MEEKLKKAIDFLCKEFDLLEDYRENFVMNDVAGLIVFLEPFENHTLEYPVDSFLEEVEECKSIKADIKKGSVATQNRFYQIVEPLDGISNLIDMHGENKAVNLAITFSNEIEVSLEFSNLIVGCAAIKISGYDKYISPFHYTTVMVTQQKGDSKLDETLASQSVDSFLFELADSHNINFTRSSFYEPIDEQFFYRDLTEIQAGQWTLRPLENFNEGISLYLAALQVANPELRLLSFYKVLEFFAPVAFNLEANELLRKKLDSSKVLSPDNAYLKSIFELGKSVDQRRNDKEMMKEFFVAALDIVGLSDLLPSHLKQNVSYSNKSADIDSYKRKVAEALYATRNIVAHAKSNYTPTGNECPPNEIPQFNKFLEAAASQAIRWYNRLPEHQKYS